MFIESKNDAINPAEIFTISIMSIANIIVGGRYIGMPFLSILVQPMNITMQCLTRAIACFPLVFHFLFHSKYRLHGAGLVYHLTFQEVHTRRRKQGESKHHGAVKELTSKHKRFDWLFLEK